MGLLEPQHILLIVIALLLFFGGKKIPELMRGLGKGMKEFQDAQNGESSNPTRIVPEKPACGLMLMQSHYL